MLTQERLKELLNYDTDTGLFINIKSRRTINIGDIAGCKNSQGYIVMMIDYTLFLAHRLAWLYVYGKFPDNCIDHINGIRHDNRIINLRDVTIGENNQNQNKRIRKNYDLPTGIKINKYNGVMIAYRSSWNDINGKQKNSPTYNFKKCGGEYEALNLAIAYRKDRISKMIAEGASYTNRHGN